MVFNYATSTQKLEKDFFTKNERGRMHGKTFRSKIDTCTLSDLLPLNYCDWPEELDSLRAELFGEKDSRDTWKPVKGFENFFIDLQELILTRKLALGSTAPLYLGTYGRREVVAKIIWPSSSEERNIRLEKKHILKEIGMLAEIQHENVVQFIGACFKSTVYCIVMEYLPGGSLGRILQKRKEPLNKKTIISVAIDIASGMAYLHSKGIIHRDLKPDNLIIDGKGKTKVTDFGSARLEEDLTDLTGETGTYRWMAPEIMDNRPYNHLVDVYSYGIVLWELVTRELPFGDMTPIQAAFAVLKRNDRPLIPNTCPRFLSQLIQQCWNADPNLRPEFSQIIQMLENYNNELIRSHVSSSLPLPFSDIRKTLKRSASFSCFKY